MAWGQVLAIELTDWLRTVVFFSIYASNTCSSLRGHVGELGYKNLSRWWRDDAMPNETLCFQRTLQTFFFFNHLSWLCFCCCVIAWLVVCVGVWLHACLLECFWLLEPGCAFCVCVWPNHLLVVGGWVLVFVFALGDVAKKETKMHFL